jgi:hypothetical protein
MIQTCGSQLKDVSVHIEPDLHEKTLKEQLVTKETELEELTFEKEFEVKTLTNQLEVRNISLYKVCFTNLMGT